MSELFAYMTLGFRHIVSIDAGDHLLFLVALAAVYRPRDWRAALLVVSAFTVGHSITLALAATHVLRMPVKLVEFLIPITIMVTCVENVLLRDVQTVGWQRWRRPALAASFGLVHGAGFASYLDSLLMTEIARPLFGFNVGIEVGQILVLSVIAVLCVTIDALLACMRNAAVGFQWRVIGVSAAVLLVASRIAWERIP